MYIYGNAALRSPAEILFFTVFTDTALLLDLEAPPEGQGSTLRATDKNHLVLQLMANKPRLCAYQGLLRCVLWLCPAVPPPPPWGTAASLPPPASWGNQPCAVGTKCWGLCMS